MKVRLKPGGSLHLVALRKVVRPGDEVDLPREVVERHAGRFEILKNDRPKRMGRVMLGDVEQYQSSPGWYDMSDFGEPMKVRRTEAKQILAKAQNDTSEAAEDTDE